MFERPVQSSEAAAGKSLENSIIKSHLISTEIWSILGIPRQDKYSSMKGKSIRFKMRNESNR